MPSEPLATALFLTLAMSAAGCVHVLWLKSSVSNRWQQPIDQGLSWRGQRLFGPNKMLRGLMALPPAAALSFGLFGAVRESMPSWFASGMWPLSPWQFTALGFICGLAFMLAELPNSFLKRQLGVASGSTAETPGLRLVFLISDRCDSVLGVLIVVSLLLPMTALAWFWTLAIGLGLHAGFSKVLHWLGIKGRAL